MFARPLPQVLVTSLALAATSHAVPALEQRANSAVWTWAHDAAQCKTDVCTSDCQSAAAQVCAMPDLSTTQSVTVGGCTAFYWYDTGNTLPSAKDCNAAFTTITGPASKAGSAGDCPGYVGGASGYGADGKRTNDPLYMISPSTGNGNCLKAPGDTSSVLAKDELPNGKSLSTCPTSSSRRKRAASTEASLEERDTKCPLEELFVGSGCSGTCLVSVTAAGWETGPFVAAGWLACIGVCSTAAAKTYIGCKKEHDPNWQWHTKRTTWETTNPCLNVPLYSWPCADMENDIMGLSGCSAAQNEPNTTGTGSVNT